MLDFVIGKGRLRYGIPIDQIVTAIEVTLVEKLFKKRAYRFINGGVHREGKSGIITGTAYFLNLFQDFPPVGIAPFMTRLFELFPGKVTPCFARAF